MRLLVLSPLAGVRLPVQRTGHARGLCRLLDCSGIGRRLPSIYRWTRVCLLIEVFVLRVCFFLGERVCECVLLPPVVCLFCFIFFFMVVAAVVVVGFVVAMSRQHLKLETCPAWSVVVVTVVVVIVVLWDIFVFLHSSPVVYINQLAGVANLWHFIDICGLIFALTDTLLSCYCVCVCACMCVRVRTCGICLQLNCICVYTLLKTIETTWKNKVSFLFNYIKLILKPILKCD